MEQRTMQLPSLVLHKTFSQIDDIQWKLKMRSVCHQWHEFLWRHSKKSWTTTKHLQVKFTDAQLQRRITIQDHRLIFSRDLVMGIFASKSDCCKAMSAITSKLAFLDTLSIIYNGLQPDEECASNSIVLCADNLHIKNLRVHHVNYHHKHKDEFSEIIQLLLQKYKASLQCLSGTVLSSGLFLRKDTEPDLSGLKHLNLTLHSSVLNEHQKILPPILEQFHAEPKNDYEAKKTISLRALNEINGIHLKWILPRILPEIVRGVALTLWPGFSRMFSSIDLQREMPIVNQIQHLTLQVQTDEDLALCVNGTFLPFVTRCPNLASCQIVALFLNADDHNYKAYYCDLLKQIREQNVQKDIEFTLHFHCERIRFYKQQARYQENEDPDVICSEFVPFDRKIIATAILFCGDYQMRVKVYDTYQDLRDVLNSDLYADRVFDKNIGA